MNVDRAAGRIAGDDAHRPRRIGLCPSEARQCRQRGSARGQTQKISAGKFHFEPPFTSFDHLVGASEQHWWYFEAKSFCGLEIDHQLKFAGQFYWKIGWLGTFDNSVDERRRTNPILSQVHSVTYQTAVVC